VGIRPVLIQGALLFYYSAGDIVVEEFGHLYYLECATRMVVLAYQTGQPLNVMSEEFAEKTARDREDFADSNVMHFEQRKLILDHFNPGYAD